MRSRILAGAARFILTVRPVANPNARSQSRSCGSAVAISIVEFEALSGRMRYLRASDSGSIPRFRVDAFQVGDRHAKASRKRREYVVVGRQAARNNG
jgi:hypothetical protein